MKNMKQSGLLNTKNKLKKQAWSFLSAKQAGIQL